MNHLFNEVYDTEKLLHSRNIRAKALVALYSHLPVEDSIPFVRLNIAKRLVDNILDIENLFKIKTTRENGVEYLEYSVECFVLTLNELCELKRKSFKDGIHHAQQFLRMGQ